MTPTKPYHVVALHRIDGMVLLGEFDSAAERDDSASSGGTPTSCVFEREIEEAAAIANG